MKDSNRDIAVSFLKLASSGNVREAYSKFVDAAFRHHNPFFEGSAESLMAGMEENARQNPNKIFEVKRALAEGDLVVTHSYVQQKPGDLGAAVVHIFRFENGYIVELWDLGQPLPGEIAKPVWNVLVEILNQIWRIIMTINNRTVSKKPKPITISIPKIRAGFKGHVFTMDDRGYDEARTVFYGGIDRRPAAIVKVANANDVSHGISLAREHDLELAIRSGGHSTAGHSVTEGGIVLDFSDMKDLQINVQERTAWVESGLTAGEYTTAAGEYGLATGFGDTGSVGIGGITLGGGVGYLVRKYGLTIDDLLAAEVVTADGQLLHVDGKSHPDLFWAIRGGGGNFGAATRFQFRLHELDDAVGGMLILPATPDVIASFISEAEAAPDELSTIANVMPAPPMPFLPAEVHGKLIIFAMLVYAGDVAVGERVLAPFRKLAVPLADMLKPMKYPEIYQPEQEGYHPVAAGRTMFMDFIDRSVAETILDHIRTSTGSMAVAQLRVLGGAMARVPADATAFAHRKSRIMVNVAALYESLKEKSIHEAWVTDFAASLRQSDNGAYVNFLGDVDAASVRSAYPGSTWDRLAEIKSRYDPTNLFRLNQNIPPAMKSSRK